MIQRSPQEFEFEDAAPGAYLVVAQASAEGRSYRGVQLIEMGDQAADEITVTLQPGVEISGVVVVEGEGADEFDRFEVFLAPGDNLPNFGPEPRGKTDERMRFRLENVLPGIWDIGVEPIPKGGYLKAMLLGDQDVLTEDMVIGPESRGPLTIVLSTRGARLEGHVESEQPLGNRRAVVLLAPMGKYSHVLSFHREALTQGNGRFVMEGLTPGPYKLYAFEEMETYAWFNPDFLKPYEERGVPVDLREGQTAKQNVPLLPAPVHGGER